MTELEQRLTNEFGKLAEQYEQEQKRLAGQVERLEEQVRKLAEQYARDQKRLAEQVQQLAEQQASDLNGYIEWSENMAEQQGILNAHVEKLTKAYNELARLLDEG